MRRKIFIGLVVVAVFIIGHVSFAYSENMKRIWVHGKVTYQGIGIPGCPVSIYVQGLPRFPGVPGPVPPVIQNIYTVTADLLGNYSITLNLDFESLPKLIGWLPDNSVEVGLYVYNLGFCKYEAFLIDSYNYYTHQHTFREWEGDSGQYEELDPRQNFYEFHRDFGVANYFGCVARVVAVFVNRTGMPVPNAGVYVWAMNDSTGRWDFITDKKTPRDIRTNQNGIFSFWLDNVDYSFDECSRILIYCTDFNSNRGGYLIERSSNAIDGNIDSYGVIIRSR